MLEINNGICQLRVCYINALPRSAGNEKELDGTTEKRHEEFDLENITSSHNISIDFLPSLYNLAHAAAAGGARNETSKQRW